MDTIRREVCSLAAVLGFAFILMVGAALVIPSDFSQWYLIAFAWIGLVAIGVGVTLEGPDRARHLLGYVAKGGCVGALIGVVSSSAVLLPYLLGIGGRTLDDLGGDAETSAAAFLTLFLYVVVSSVIGIVSAALVGASRSTERLRR